MRARLIALAMLAALPSGREAVALELTLPGSATMTREVLRDPDSYHVPVAPFTNGALPAQEVEGRILQQAWRLDKTTLTTLQMLRPLREQLGNGGFDVILDCAGQECGGFDFRFSTRIMPAPDMYVDLFDYRFLSAIRGGDDQGRGAEAEYVTVVVSRSGNTGYLQITHTTPPGGDSDTLSVATERYGAAALPTIAEPNSPPPDLLPEDLVAALIAQGHVVLGDLDFATGSAALGDGSFASLDRLAQFLTADPSRRVALVGHTDAVGGLDPNVALSRRRAESVLDRLVQAHGVSPTQLEAGGMGYLSPIASNLTPEGREANRRVEAVLLNTE